MENEKIVDEVLEGNMDPLKAYAKLRDMEKEIKKSLEMISEVVLDEAKKYGAKSFEHAGCKFEIRNGAKRYSFKNIDEWNKKQGEVKEVEARAKLAWESYQKGVNMVDDDGVILEIPEVTFSKDTLTYKKLR